MKSNEDSSYEERILNVLDLDKRFADMLSIYYKDGIETSTLIRFSIKLFVSTAIQGGANLNQMKQLLDGAYESLKLGLDSSTINNNE